MARNVPFFGGAEMVRRNICLCIHAECFKSQNINFILTKKFIQFCHLTIRLYRKCFSLNNREYYILPDHFILNVSILITRRFF